MKKNLLGVSLITMACLYGLLAAVVILVCIFTYVPIIYGIVASIIILIIQFLVSPFLTDLSMKWFYGAKFDYIMPERVNSFINYICKKYNMKYPRIGYIDDGAPNAFTYGRTKNDARIVVTRGLFEILSQDEVETVIAHELGHATHYDMLFMTVAQLVPLILYAVYEMFSRSNSNDKDNSALAQIGLLAYVLYVISQYIILWLSRTREYYADSFAIEETRNPNALAEALVKIGFGLVFTGKNTEQTKKKHASAAKTNALGIFDSKASKALVVSSYTGAAVSKESIKNAMKWEMWNPWAIFYELHSTHPLISKRLTKISERCYEFNQNPYIVFDLNKPESYFDDFIFEVILNYLPIMLVVLSFIAFLFTEELLCIGIGGTIAMVLSFVKLNRVYKNSNYKQTNVANLLSEVKVSGITSIPCIVEGKIIGRGNPGCIFNEDFTIKDDTGIIFLDYNQPVHIINKIFALFKSREYFEKDVKITGWYRRSPVPYIEIKTMEVDGKIKKCHTYAWTKAIRVILLILSIIMLVISISSL